MSPLLWILKMQDDVARGKLNWYQTWSCKESNRDPGLAPTWAKIPTSLLREELSRRQEDSERPKCGSKGGSKDYNLPLHVFALFLILILSTLGMC